MTVRLPFGSLLVNVAEVQILANHKPCPANSNSLVSHSQMLRAKL